MTILKKINLLLFIFIGCMLSGITHAQMVKDESKWKYSAKKIKDNQYQITFHAQLPKGWHVYAMKPGGDGSLISPAFIFDKNKSIALKDSIKEKGKLISEKLEGIDGIVNMYMGVVEYTQDLTIAENTTIKGTYSYQICNDKMCLPPFTKNFKIDITDAGAGSSANAPPAAGQMIKDESKWTFDTKKIDNGQYQFNIHADLPTGWHVYAIKPGGDGSLNPTSITFDKNDNITIKDSLQEKSTPVSKSLIGIDGIVNMYEGTVDLVQNLTVTQNTNITGIVNYQICNDQMCLPPVTKIFTVTITDAGGNSAAQNDSAAKAGIAASSQTNGSSKTKGDKSLLWLFLASLAGGLAAVITPCVYSMIPITVSFFTKRSKTRKEGIRNALYYSLSIILIFTILGVLISAIFGANALNSLSTNWIANLFFFVIFIVFGISFLGAFEITLPSSWTNATDSKAGTGNFMGIFFMALTLAIVSFSCTGPIVGPLLVLAGKGGIAGPAVGMFGFSVGLAFPFALFAVFPGMLNKMASSGGWLNQVKVVLGFLELMLALKFLSNADLAMGWRLLDREIFIALWIVISILLGVYLLGKIKFSHDDVPAQNIYGQEYVSTFKLFLAIAAFTFAVYLLPGMSGAPLNGVSAFLPPMGTFSQFGGNNASVPVKAIEGGSTAGPVKYVNDLKIYEPPVVISMGLVTYYDYDEALAVAKKLKKPIMLDFTGINCVNCRKMEAQVWSNAEVSKRLKEDFIVVSLYCDLNRIELPKAEQYFSKDLNSTVVTLGNKNADLQAAKFGSNSQPLYFYVDENGTKLAEDGYPYDPDVDKFIRHLENVKANYKKLHP